MPDSLTLPPSIDQLKADIDAAGYARLAGAQTLRLLESLAAADWAAADWEAFARSWNRLGQDIYMADGGRYRRRRHATFRFSQGAFVRKSHQPHFQSRDYNPLNGDVQRWFDPVEHAVIEINVMQAILTLCGKAFADAAPAHHVEVHQFRVEARPGEAGRPTPEGLHRDGVDHVFVMLIGRRNVREGVTQIGAPDGRTLGEFTLAQPGDAILLDDRRILHGVTEIHAIDPTLPAYRDALVVTFAGER